MDIPRSAASQLPTTVSSAKSPRKRCATKLTDADASFCRICIAGEGSVPSLDGRTAASSFYPGAGRLEMGTDRFPLAPREKGTRGALLYANLPNVFVLATCFI